MADHSKYLGTADLVVFFGTIGFAVIVGIYYAVVDRKKNVDNYYYGGRKMSPVPVGLSISVTNISALTIIGIPAETYFFGSAVFWYAVLSPITTTVVCLYFIPLIHRLRLTTINEYLELRFHRYLRRMASGAYTLTLIIYLGTTIYLPALALNAVTPLSLMWTIGITTFFCTLYTTVGGMKAVVWTDFFQAIAMVSGALAAMIKTIINVGGFGNVFAAAERGKRLNFWNIDSDPTLRYTVWTFVLGYLLPNCSQLAISQPIAQRFLACKSVRQARIAALVAVVPTFMLLSIAPMTGLAMYAYYEGCDPLTTKKISKPDQMMPYLVVDVFQNLPGMAGLYVAAAFSGTLSSISSGLNALAVIILQDFIVPIKPNLSEALRLTISKAVVSGLGLVVLGLAIFISKLDATIMRVITSFFGSIVGPLCGVFVLGLFFPWANAKGTIVGQIIATAFSLWLAFGSLFKGKSSSSKLPLSTEQCISNSTENITKLLWTTKNTISTTPLMTESIVATTTDMSSGGLESSLYAISYLYYGVIAMAIAVLVGLLVSFVTGHNNPKKMNPALFVPIVDNSCLPEKVRKFFRFGVPEIPEKNTEEDQKFHSSLSDDQKTEEYKRNKNKATTNDAEINEKIWLKLEAKEDSLI